ncbi:hypothetical protein, partial [Candidatus Bathycorpusculum sp.]|uniref:hypothetical protein n=1 Tax=Candidatus Bathycorpusculum sp. TaxID=2994959 RepID=UPI00282800DA|nr:hypothetical protein [Candidatus Termitimicrobium sp.]MCL2431702.1 hypothetical protein [Candidatus Termitimicrobium sp.]
VVLRDSTMPSTAALSANGTTKPKPTNPSSSNPYFYLFPKTTSYLFLLAFHGYSTFNSLFVIHIHRLLGVFFE